MTDLVVVRVTCPSGEHADGDSVSLRPKLGLAGGIEAQQLIQNLTRGATSAALTGLLMECYLRHGVASWELHDSSGEPVELTPDTLGEQLLADFERAMPVADEADRLYSAAVLNPLRAAASKSSRAMRRARSTSRPKGLPAQLPKRSRRSSTTTTPTVVTAPTSD